MSKNWLWRADIRRAGSAFMATFVGLILFLPLLMISYTKVRPAVAGHSSLVIMSLTKAIAQPPRSVPAKSAFQQQSAAPDSEGVSTIDEVPSTEGPSLSPSCDLSPLIGKAIEEDILASQSIANMRPELRSLSDAIMLWNGRWPDPVASDLSDPMVPIRTIITQVILKSPINCQSSSMTGPLFIAIRDRDKMTMLVIGSGVWRWDELLERHPATSPPAGPTDTNFKIK